MTKKLVFLRTHLMEPYIVSEYRKLCSSLNEGDECILFIDNTRGLFQNRGDSPVGFLNINNTRIKCFLYDVTVQKESGLPTITNDINNSKTGKLLWYNGDYPFYYLRKYFPDYDYYWCSEYDVFCNGNSYKPFFQRYEQSDCDFISTSFEQLNQNNNGWEWFKNTDWVYPQKNLYKSFFPVVRLSSNSIDFLIKRRKEHEELFKKYQDNKNARWIFCELFVPTELMNNGYKSAVLDEPNIRFTPEYNLNKERFFETPDFRLYHPVR